MKVKDIVKFENPLDDDEESSLMIVIEIRDERVSVSDLRFSEWAVPPTDVYPFRDLTVVDEFSNSEVKK